MHSEKLWNFLQAHFEDFHGKGWIFEVFIIVLVTLVITLILRLAYKRILPRFEKTKNVWDEAVLRAVHKPFNFLIWVIGLASAGSIVRLSTDESNYILDAIPTLRSFGFIIAVTWFLIRLIKQAEEIFISGREGHPRMDKTTAIAVGKILKASVIITATLVAMQSFGIKITGVLAFGGIGGAAIAFSAKDLLANFFGGLIIYLDRPFAVGDWIRSPDRQIEGTVEYIGWRLCRIRTFDKRPLYVPNAIFTTISIENPSRMTNRRIKTNIGLRYDDASKVNTILKDIEDMLKNHPEIDTSQTLMVNLVEFGASSLNFMVYTFTKTTNWVKFQSVQQDVFVKIIDIIESHGAQCAFPTTTLHVPEPVCIESN